MNWKQVFLLNDLVAYIMQNFNNLQILVVEISPSEFDTYSAIHSVSSVIKLFGVVYVSLGHEE